MHAALRGFNAVMELIRIMSMKMLKKCMAVGLLVSVLTSSGCAVVMASNQPSKKNLSVLNTGISRNHVIAEFGAPVASE